MWTAIRTPALFIKQGIIELLHVSLNHMNLVFRTERFQHASGHHQLQHPTPPPPTPVTDIQSSIKSDRHQGIINYNNSQVQQLQQFRSSDNLVCDV